MYRKLILIFILIFSLVSCSKNKDIEYEINKDKVDPYKLYEEGLDAFSKADYFYAEKKFSEAELNFKIVELAAKSAVMSSYSLYGINFYNEALENLERYLKKYPADKNVMYAHYLIAIIHFIRYCLSRKYRKNRCLIDPPADFFRIWFFYNACQAT